MRKVMTVCFSISILALLSLATVSEGVEVSGSRISLINGDVNGDDTLDVSDVIYLLNWEFVGGPPPVPLACEPFNEFMNGDVNGRGGIDITDPIYLLDYLYLGGDAPVEACPLKR